MNYSELALKTIRNRLLAEDGNSIEVAVPDENILFDVDSPADYQERLARFQRDNVPLQRSVRSHGEVSG